MTAPLKYRAWSIPRQCYIPLLSIMFDITGEPIAINGRRTPISEVVLERWTGRVDRDDNPIFEGDLLQLFNIQCGEYHAVGIDVVEWRESTTYTGFGLTERGCAKHLVIGNVHEHVGVIPQRIAA